MYQVINDFNKPNTITNIMINDINNLNQKNIKKSLMRNMDI